MIQVTNIQDLKTAVNQNGETVITMNNDDIRKGRVRDAREVFKEWKGKYGMMNCKK